MRARAHESTKICADLPFTFSICIHMRIASMCVRDSLHISFLLAGFFYILFYFSPFCVFRLLHLIFILFFRVKQLYGFRWQHNDISTKLRYEC